MPDTFRASLRKLLPRPIYHVARHVDHIWKRAMNIADPGWAFYAFERSFHPDITGKHEARLLQAQGRLASLDSAREHAQAAKSDEPLVVQGLSLLQAALSSFHKILADEQLRVMVHCPAPADSPGGWSAFMNLAGSLNYVGVETRVVGRRSNLMQDLEEFRPHLLLSGDHPIFVSNLDWPALQAHRMRHPVTVGLYTGPEPHGVKYSVESARWARTVDANFFFSFRASNYVNASSLYAPFREAGFTLVFLPFGANVLHYYPVTSESKDIPFVFLASQNPVKFARYQRYMGDILSGHGGFVDGPGWRHARTFEFSADRDRYLYARAQVGLNIHLDEQIATPCEVNERTFQLAACGVPQVIDNPAMLPLLFSQDACYVASTPREYLSCFEQALRSKAESQRRALVAQREVFQRHTTFHRAVDFVSQLRQTKLLDNLP